MKLPGYLWTGVVVTFSMPLIVIAVIIILLAVSILWVHSLIAPVHFWTHWERGRPRQYQRRGIITFFNDL